jgi:hypothetical protein
VACDPLFVSLDGLSGRKVQIDTRDKRQGGHLPKIEHWASDCQYVGTSGGVKCNFSKKLLRLFSSLRGHYQLSNNLRGNMWDFPKKRKKE